MAGESPSIPNPEVPPGHGQGAIEMPRPTVAPMVLSLGLVLVGLGLATNLVFTIVGGIILFIGLGIWIGQMLPGQGHIHEPRVAEGRPRPITGLTGTVEQLRPGMPGYRVRLPENVHPISAGLKGGILGGLVMPVPALAYGLFSGHGLWYPVNLLAGIVLPNIAQMSDVELGSFHLSLLIVAILIHAVNAVVFGLIYGVLLPTLPDIHRYLSWGGLLMPLLWTAVTFGLMGTINPVLAHGVDWPWFIFSQFVFGVVAAAVLIRAERYGPIRAGLLGGLVGALIMPIPAILWSLATRHGLWYPANLLAGMVLPSMVGLSVEQLEQFHADWFGVAIAMHAVMSLGIGLVNGLLLPRLSHIPGPLAWGGLLLPLVWTAVTYGLMGVADPVLQEKVDWPWFIVSQFVYGIVTAYVVHRSELIHIPPAGAGPDRVAPFVTG